MIQVEALVRTNNFLPSPWLGAGSGGSQTHQVACLSSLNKQNKIINLTAHEKIC